MATLRHFAQCFPRGEASDFLKHGFAASSNEALGVVVWREQ
jgi:hypothetical protein